MPPFFVGVARKHDEATHYISYMEGRRQRIKQSFSVLVQSRRLVWRMGHDIELISWVLLVPRVILKGTKGEDQWFGLRFHKLVKDMQELLNKALQTAVYSSEVVEGDSAGSSLRVFGHEAGDCAGERCTPPCGQLLQLLGVKPAAGVLGSEEHLALTSA